MAKAVVARRQGDDFQARIFWLYATLLLKPDSCVRKVAFESGPRGFDDIYIEYDPSNPRHGHKNQPLLRQYVQCKWHTTAGVCGYKDLVRPAFINARDSSFLQRAHRAQKRHAPDGSGCRFELLTNWHIKEGDPLLRLIRTESGSLDLERLFDGKTAHSTMGKVRKLWCDHLGIDCAEELRLLVRVLGILRWSDSLITLRQCLEDRFAAVGMKCIPATEAAFLYDDLPVKLLARGRVEFDRVSFRKMLEQENLLVPNTTPKMLPAIGVRSFMHPIDPLDERCTEMLNLVPYFDGRYICNDADWQRRVYPDLSRFLLGAARKSDHLRLIVDAHASLAFAIGSVLNVKSGKKIEIEQRSGGRRFWSIDDDEMTSDWPLFEFEEELVNADTDDIALAIGVTHDIAADVRAHVRASDSQIGRILHCRPCGGASQQLVRCGRHASILAESVVQKALGISKRSLGTSNMHLFVAGPNSFLFFLGQHQQALGRVSSYEWDFERRRGGGYCAVLTIGA